MEIEVREELIRLETDGGRLNPEHVIEAARDPQSRLHHYFDWDDGVAAHKWRLAQARTLIRIVRDDSTPAGPAITVVRYIRDQTQPPRQTGYRTVTAVSGERDTARTAFLYELGRTFASIRRLRDLADRLGYGDVVWDLLLRLTGLQALVQGPKDSPEP